MSGLSDLFTVLPDLADLQVDELVAWAPSQFSPEVLDNYYGNRILYAEALAVDDKGYQLDLVILKAAISRQKGSYCNPSTKRLTIPIEIQQLVLNPVHLAEIFLDVCHPEQVTYVMANPATSLGTFVVPTVTAKSGTIVITVDGRNHKVPIGAMTQIPAGGNKIQLSFNSLGATILNQNQIDLEVTGGAMGIIIDARIR